MEREFSYADRTALFGKLQAIHDTAKDILDRVDSLLERHDRPKRNLDIFESPEKAREAYANLRNCGLVHCPMEEWLWMEPCHWKKENGNAGRCEEHTP